MEVPTFAGWIVGNVESSVFDAWTVLESESQEVAASAYSFFRGVKWAWLSV